MGFGFGVERLLFRVLDSKVAKQVSRTLAPYCDLSGPLSSAVQPKP